MIDTKGLDDFRSEWDRLNKQEEAAKYKATQNTDKIDATGTDEKIEPVEPASKAAEPEAASVVESKDDDSENTGTQATSVVEPAKLNFKQAFAAARKAGEKTFEWEGKKFAAKLKGEVNKPVQTAKPAPAKAAEDSDEYSNGWKEDQSSAESSRLANSKPTMAVSTGLLGNFVPESWMGRNNNPETTKTVQVAKVASPAKTSSPSGRDYSGNAKAADSTKAIADKMGVDSKTLLPKQETRTASSGKGSQG